MSRMGRPPLPAKQRKPRYTPKPQRKKSDENMITVWIEPQIIFKSMYGRVTGYEWLEKEKARQERITGIRHEIIEEDYGDVALRRIEIN